MGKRKESRSSLLITIAAAGAVVVAVLVVETIQSSTVNLVLHVVALALGTYAVLGIFGILPFPRVR